MYTNPRIRTILSRGLWLRGLLTLLLMSGMLAAGHPATTAVLAPTSYNPNELSYGLYWFGNNGANQKFVAGEPNAYFDPTQPTLIFAHGWQPFISDSLPDFDFNGIDTAAGWIAAGWNVGIFVWNQFSDETTGVTLGAWFGDGPPPQGVLDAEAKIWSANGPRGMRWRDWDNYLTGYSDPPPGTPSAGELFYQTYTAALPESYTQTIRIAGHSLGNQMAVRLTHLVDAGIAAGDVPANLRPARVALLDPYWSPEARTDIPDGPAAGRKTGDVVREIIAGLTSTGTLFEWYWSSIWTTPPQGDANDALKPMVFYAEMDPAFETDDLDKHLAAQHLYFWSHAFEGPADCAGDACLEMTRVLSKMSDQQLADAIETEFQWVQNGGQDTETPNDDTYHSFLTVTKTVTALDVVTFEPLPVTVTINHRGPADCLSAITVTQITQDHPEAVAAHLQNGRYWSITQSNCALNDVFTVTLTIPLGDVISDPLHKLCRWTGAAWDCGEIAAHTIGDTYITRRDIHQFSTWTVGYRCGPSVATLGSFAGMGEVSFIVGGLLLAIGGWGTLLMVRGRSQKRRPM